MSLFDTVSPKRKLKIYQKDGYLNYHQIMKWFKINKTIISLHLGIKPDSIRFDKRATPETRDIFLKLAQILELVMDFLKDENLLRMWLNTYNPALEFSPIMFIKYNRDGESIDKLIAVILEEKNASNG